MLCGVMLSVVMLSVIMLSVMASVYHFIVPNCKYKFLASPANVRLSKGILKGEVSLYH
jgi:hypothetical protein